MHKGVVVAHKIASPEISTDTHRKFNASSPLSCHIFVLCTVYILHDSVVSATIPRPLIMSCDVGDFGVSL